MTKQTETWHNLAALGFSAWEHSEVYVSTTANSNTRHCELRMVGSNFAVRVFDNGQGLFAAIKAIAEKVS